MNGDGIQVRWFGHDDNATPWAMLDDLPDGTAIRWRVTGGVDTVGPAARRCSNRAVLVVAWPDGSTPTPPTIVNTAEALDISDHECESCGEPAVVAIGDGSVWCESCHGSAIRLGYDR